MHDSAVPVELVLEGRVPRRLARGGGIGRQLHAVVVGHREFTEVVHRDELTGLGIDVQQPIAPGDGSEERQRWEELVEQVKAGSSRTAADVVAGIRRGIDRVCPSAQSGDDDR